VPILSILCKIALEMMAILRKETYNLTPPMDPMDLICSPSSFIQSRVICVLSFFFSSRIEVCIIRSFFLAYRTVFSYRTALQHTL